MRIRPLIIALAVAIACRDGLPTGTHNGIRRSGGGSASVHTLSHSGDGEANYIAWLDSINADCSDSVVGDFGAGQVTILLQDKAIDTLRMASTCTNANRHVEIKGYDANGVSNSIIVVNSATSNGGGFGLVVADSFVHIHGLTFRGNAYDFPQAAVDGSVGEGVQFLSTANHSEADHLTISEFSDNGIDVFGAKAVFVHDNSIVCPSGVLQGYSIGGAGVWVRQVEPPLIPGFNNGTVEGNYIYNCGAEGITIEGSSYISVLKNQIFCQFAACNATSIGIAIYSDMDLASKCRNAMYQSSYNTVSQNVVYANNGISAGIAVKTGGGKAFGSGHQNYIDSNTVLYPGINVVDSLTKYSFGIEVNQLACGGDASSAFSGTYIKGDSIVGAWVNQIYNGGDSDSVVNNHVHLANRGTASQAIINASVNSFLSGNTISQ